MKNKVDRLSSLAAKAVAEAINREIEFENMLITVSRVELTADFGLIRVFIRVLPEEKTQQAINLLYRNKNILRGKLIKLIKLNRLPKLGFYVDNRKIQDEDNYF